MSSEKPTEAPICHPDYPHQTVSKEMIEARQTIDPFCTNPVSRHNNSPKILFLISSLDQDMPGHPSKVADKLAKMSDAAIKKYNNTFGILIREYMRKNDLPEEMSVEDFLDLVEYN